MILAFDPSGNFHEGKGTTGYCFGKKEIEGVGNISATPFSTQYEYWKAHVDLIKELKPSVLVMEGYRLYHHKGMAANTQANSILETPQIIGLLSYLCWNMNIKLVIQFAKDVKTRWSDDVLLAKGILTKKGRSLAFKDGSTVKHERDAIRHYLHYERYKK